MLYLDFHESIRSGGISMSPGCFDSGGGGGAPFLSKVDPAAAGPVSSVC